MLNLLKTYAMKKFIIAVAAIAVGFVQANAMSHTRAQSEALFLTDKMAYELNLTDAQYDAVYEINYDYFVSLVGTSDILGIFWNRRERELEWVLTSGQYRVYLATTYFYRPVAVYNNVLRFAIYDHYARDRYYKPIRHVHKIYKGGHAYKAPGHHDKGHFYANNHKPAGNHNDGGKMAPGNGNHKPDKVAPNTGSKPSGNKPDKVAPNTGSKPSVNNGGKVAPNTGSKPAGRTGGNVSGNSAKPRTSGTTTRSSSANRASRNAPSTGRSSSAARR